MNWKFWQKKEKDPNQPPKSKLREWLDALIWAGGAALLIRTFLLEAFMIPTSSMERTMMVGDFLFVSKFHYGPRVPMTFLSVPFVHNKLPFVNVPSFLEWIRIPYMRLPGFTDIKRNDIVVFNYPADDIKPNNPELGPIRIPSFKENYIKRCVAQAGDTLEIRDGQVFINGQPGWNPPDMQFQYYVLTEGGLSYDYLKKLGFRPENSDNFNWRQTHIPNVYEMFLTDSIKNILSVWPNIKKIEKSIMPRFSENDTVPIQRISNIEFFPNHPDFHWNLDQFGPLYLPKRGDKIPITLKNLPLYQRCIEAYEGHHLKVENGKIFIDGKETHEYTFEMNYYFMMGDNRYNSQDSRFWGMVPEDHIIGKPLFVLFSIERGIRWNRILKIPR
ncbi:MAG: signal peptidase I [Bacteroidia bacterium]|nr:MAG: signal peptidase I [Bacteroidia bacterium]